MTQENSTTDKASTNLKPFTLMFYLFTGSYQKIIYSSQSPHIQILLDHKTSANDNIYLDNHTEELKMYEENSNIDF
jgi:hypothetical protein